MRRNPTIGSWCIKRGTYTALSHFNFETRHGAHERSTLDLFWGASAVVAAAAAGLAWPELLVSIMSIVQRAGNKHEAVRMIKALNQSFTDVAPFALPSKSSGVLTSQGG